jgi:hypothetical protein
MRSPASSNDDGAPGRGGRHRRPRLGVLVATLLLGGLGCGPAATRPPPRVAILPVDTVGIPGAAGDTLEGSLTKTLTESRAARPVPVPRALTASTTQPADWAQCRESSVCLAELARRVPAKLILSLAVAGLGDLCLVRSRLVRATDGMVLQDLQEAVPGGRPTLARYAAHLARRLFPDAGRRPWYRQWWFYAAVVGVASATAIATWAAVRATRHETGVVHLGDL